MTKTFCDGCLAEIPPASGFRVDIGLVDRISKRDVCSDCYTHYVEFLRSTQDLVRDHKSGFRDEMRALEEEFWAKARREGEARGKAPEATTFHIG